MPSGHPDGMEAATRPLAVVTGASSGIGLELAKLFAASDFDLVIAAEDDELHVVAEGIRAAGATVDAVQVDLDEQYAQLLTLEDGLVTRDEAWLGWEDALRAAGLDSDTSPFTGPGPRP